MSDKFSIIPIEHLFRIIIESETKTEFFGVPKKHIFNPSKFEFLNFKRFGQKLENPLGLAAGPHTQLAQNIIFAWLYGARYIELKTIQTLDELEISKPCIDMQDEGYNCEWSQELHIEDSFDQYLNAWIIIHILRHKFGWTKNVGTIFNMSVGYNLEGILKDNVQRFFIKMNDCSHDKHHKLEVLEQFYPEVMNIEIPNRISDNVTLSTMHGCPPDEIEKIATYLIEDKKLHTTIKLNPTLIGAKKLRKILVEKSTFKTRVPDIAFEHDLKYQDAVNIIKNLQKSAIENNVDFGVKLTNTLESINNKNIFDKKEKMMYMSGRALHPISMTLAGKLQNDFSGQLDISFSGGADCFNIPDIISAGLSPVTVCTDILKPGGYGRFVQYFENLTKEFNFQNAKTIDNFIIEKSYQNIDDPKEAALENLNNYIYNLKGNKLYKNNNFTYPNIKTKRELSFFDCIKAPCRGTCPAGQDVPAYMHFVAQGKFREAWEVIMKNNPFPSVTGMVCDHLCQTKCTRINYDNSLLIREIKRFVAEKFRNSEIEVDIKKNGLKVAVIGAGPSGLSCAYFLALSGFEVDVYEAKEQPGGMLSSAIPSFRLTNEAIINDIKKIENLKIKIHKNVKINKTEFDKLKKENDFIFIAAGAQKAKTLNIEGINSEGVLNPLKFLHEIKLRNSPKVGKKTIILGGGNTAIDVARTVSRVLGKSGHVMIVYRRTINEMPADNDEIKSAIDEGIEIFELTSPQKIIAENNKVTGIECLKMKLEGIDKTGRPKPISVKGSEFVINCDTIIPALGQEIDFDFIDENEIKEISEKNISEGSKIFIGGDAFRGASTVINAIADGRNISEKIIELAKQKFGIEPFNKGIEINFDELVDKKVRREFGIFVPEIDISKRDNFSLVIETLQEKQAIAEASRCLNCDSICNVCVEVCPNLANYSYKVEKQNFELQKLKIVDGKVEIFNDKSFSIKQEFQVLNIGDFCNECGNCTTFCPTSGRPFADKPKFWLNIDSFKKAENGFYLSKLKNKKILLRKANYKISTIFLENDNYVFENEFAIIYFDREDFRIKNFTILNENIENELLFNDAAEIKVLYNAADKLY
ncbi:MAG: putative selenate reductase subunit YgfK [Bacteroidales bacterium]|nr:putative selenate reductase subunit YgfK [Bacteroidales bacterium]